MTSTIAPTVGLTSIVIAVLVLFTLWPFLTVQRIRFNETLQVHGSVYGRYATKSTPCLHIRRGLFPKSSAADAIQAKRQASSPNLGSN